MPFFLSARYGVGSLRVDVQWSQYIVTVVDVGHQAFLPLILVSHARIQKILSEGANFDNVFFPRLMSGGRIEFRNTTKSGPSSARQH